jgi:hypothetical protein
VLKLRRASCVAGTLRGDGLKTNRLRLRSPHRSEALRSTRSASRQLWAIRRQVASFSTPRELSEREKVALAGAADSVSRAAALEITLANGSP